MCSFRLSKTHVHRSVRYGGVNCLFYLDDIFGENLKAQNERLREIFARLRSYNLNLQPEKCKFLRTILYLGHRLTYKSLLPDESKLSQLRSFPFLKQRNLNCFLGLAGYYRRFI
jgi:hypothetical protein